MANTFFVTGLPRSRTAWFSCFLSSDNYFCYHEASARYMLEDWKAFAEAQEIPVGNSDSGLIFVSGEMVHLFPDSPVVVIRRPVEDVHTSLIKTLGFSDLNLLYRQAEKLDLLEQHPNVLSVIYDELDELSVRKIFKWVLPEFDWPEDRFNLFKNMNIQLHEIDVGNVQPIDYFTLEGLN